MMDGVHSFDPKHPDVPMVAFPEPFWIRSWRTMFRWRPACYPCKQTFRTRAEHDEHYLRTHQ